MYVNVAVYPNASGPRRFFRTKKALREALAADPQSAYFEGTSLFGPQFAGTVAELPEGVVLSAVGPDAYRDRKWYASVERIGDKIKVS